MPLVNSVIPSDGSIAEKPLVTEGFPCSCSCLGDGPCLPMLRLRHDFQCNEAAKLGVLRLEIASLLLQEHH